MFNFLVTGIEDLHVNSPSRHSKISPFHHEVLCLAFFLVFVTGGLVDVSYPMSCFIIHI